MEKAGFEANLAGFGVCALLPGLWSQTAVGRDPSSITYRLRDPGQCDSTPLSFGCHILQNWDGTSPVSSKL